VCVDISLKFEFRCLILCFINFYLFWDFVASFHYTSAISKLEMPAGIPSDVWLFVGVYWFFDHFFYFAHVYKLSSLFTFNH
jgi:hypothetical protein